ncbi:MAG: DNA polymerase II [Gammaproteobacteria bacterium]|nr:DNA polymerase II [Gammaproteobacteria bacterium]
MESNDPQQGLILTRQWQEVGEGQELVFWLATPAGALEVRQLNQESVFFLKQTQAVVATRLLSGRVTFRDVPVALQSFCGTPVVACYFKSQRVLNQARRLLEEGGIQPLEADIRPTDRFLMERFITGPVKVRGGALTTAGRDFPLLTNPAMKAADIQPSLNVMSIDIETAWRKGTLLSIALSCAAAERVFMLREKIRPGSTGYPEGIQGHDAGMIDIRYCDSERALIEAFLAAVRELDPDVLVGWNVVNFDLRFLQQKCDSLQMDLILGRNGEKVHWRDSAAASAQRYYALVPGRAVLDGIELLRTATWHFESYALESVARELLGRGKLITSADNRAEEIERLYVEDSAQLAAYNLEDCRLVLEIFAQADLIHFAVARTSLSGLDLDRAGGSVAAFDYLYLPRLHRQGRVAPSAGSGQKGVSPGGYVLSSEAGLFDHVIVMDFKSLYPSIIRTFHVDPLAMAMASEENDPIPGFKGARFSRQQAILPGIIESLWQARDEAKKAGDVPLSQAIKIMMNSFYGVLGTASCRFFDERLVSSITLRGHAILQQTRDLIEAQGYKVIYGDTDSVFVLLNDVASIAEASTVAEGLVQHLNLWWDEYLLATYQIESCLEIEFESYFEKFLMPTVRGSDKGSKKRYAGLKKTPSGTTLVFKGLETVRSDWTPLARQFQRVLYEKIFNDEPVEDYIRGVVAEVLAGNRDSDLVLRRRVRRPLASYQKNVPPHVRAARILTAHRQRKGLPPSRETGGWIAYVMTINGPEPTECVSASIDYQFYIEKQLLPVADAIISFKGLSFQHLVDAQMALF